MILLAHENIGPVEPETETTETVLIVDDSAGQRKLVALSLKKLGYKVLEAKSGHEAMALCRKYDPDLVISDWMMPGMSGLELCQAYRKLRDGRYGYFILLTSKSDKGDIAEGLDVGADDLLVKPFNPAELRARIQAGERILRMERTLTEQNRLVRETLEEMQVLYDAIDQDLIEARKLQQSLVPDRFVQLGGGALSMMLKPAGHVGGDLVGAFQVTETEVGFYSLDVSGHGVASALLTARLAGHLSSNLPRQNVAIEQTDDGPRMRPPSEAVEALNRLMLEEMETEHYFTILLARANLVTGEVSLCQAGHPNPLIQRNQGGLSFAGTGGLPVGLIPGATYEEFEIKLEPGDRLLLGSDGITECENTNGVMLEDEGLAKMIGKLHSLSGLDMLEALEWTLSDYNGDKDFADDVSGVLFEFKGRDAESDRQSRDPRQKQ